MAVSAWRTSSGRGVFSGEGVDAGVDLDGVVAAQCEDELLDRPTGPGLDPVGDGQRGEHHGEVRVEGLAFAVVDRPGPQIVLGPEGVLDPP
jgi:hypothetical protein